MHPGEPFPWTDPLCQVTRDLAPQAYRLTVSSERILLESADAAGKRFGLATLRQLKTLCPLALPLCIEDAPAFPIRGFMLDISRDRVPSREHLGNLVQLLALWKINHLQLYVEHTFAATGHSYWLGFSALSAQDLRWLDDLCQENGITLASNQNCLGHLERILQHPEYQRFAEVAPGQTWQNGTFGTRQGPFSLCPTDPQAQAFLLQVLDEHIAAIRSPLVNIGCDETYDLGQGRSAEAVKRDGRAKVYGEYVASICQHLRERGRQTLMWADIALEEPAILDLLPSDLIGLVWGYEPDATFAKGLQALRTKGLKGWVCPGTSCWRSITGRSTERSGNLAAATHQGLQHGAEGFLITAWGDEGHRQTWPITAHALAQAANTAWTGSAEWDPRASGQWIAGCPALGTWLEKLGDLDFPLRKSAQIRNASAMFKDTLLSWQADGIGTCNDWHQVLGRLEDQARGSAHLELSDHLIEAEIAFTLADAFAATTRAIARRSAHVSSGTRRQLHEAWKSIAANHQALWPTRSAPGGLDHSVSHYLKLAEEVSTASEKG
jgi:hypothetical protein